MRHVRPETPLNGDTTMLITPEGRRHSADAVPALVDALEKALPWLEECQAAWTKLHGGQNEVLGWRIAAARMALAQANAG